MKRVRAGILSLAVAFPTLRRANAYWEERYPDMVAAARAHASAKVWRSPRDDDEAGPFDQALRPFFHDPFLGARERRWLEPGRKVLDLEVDAATSALRAAGLDGAAIDLALVSSLFPDRVGIGNAAFLAERLGIRCGLNVESACASAIASLVLARGLLESGQAERVLVVVSCSYSRLLPETDPMCWANGDGAAAFVLGPGEGAARILSGHLLATTLTNDAVLSEAVVEDGRARIRMRAEKDAGAKIRDVSAPALKTAVGEALAKAGRRLDDVGFVVVPTPLAWYADFAAACLGIPREKTLDTHARYANTGPVLTPTNLFHAAHEGRIEPGDLVVLYGVGSSSSAGALVVEWGDVALGPPPPP